VAVYESMLAAGLKTKCDNSDIGRCCRKQIEYVRGFKWEYATIAEYNEYINTKG